MNTDITSDQPVQQNIQVVGIGRRLVAIFIDIWILIFIVNLLVLGITSIITPSLNATSPIFILFDFLALLIAGAYFTSFWILNGQTPGKKILGIKVITTNGSPMTVGQAILRFIGYIIGAVIMGLGFIWAAFDRKRQGWHDKMAKTYVVSKDTQVSSVDTIIVVPPDSTKLDTIIVLLLIVSILLTFITLSIFAP